jgi:hypothetical protein
MFPLLLILILSQENKNENNIFIIFFYLLGQLMDIVYDFILNSLLITEEWDGLK